MDFSLISFHLFHYDINKYDFREIVYQVLKVALLMQSQVWTVRNKQVLSKTTLTFRPQFLL